VNSFYKLPNGAVALKGKLTSRSFYEAADVTVSINDLALY